MNLLHTIIGSKKAPLIIATIIMLALMSFGIMKANAPVMVPLYSSLSIEDSSAILSKLQVMNIPYESSADGKQIMVPSRQVFMVRMALAQEGIPHSGNIVGYEIFDKSEPLGSSQFVHNVNLVRALEGELARTIGSISQIEHARVHLVIPKKELFAKAGAEPSASVVVKTRGGQTLGRSEIGSISYLVTHAVPGLNVERVTIVDSMGRPLKIGAGQQDMGALASTLHEYQNNLEHKLESEITALVERSVGLGKVQVNVTADIDFDRQTVNTETFDPNGQVLRSRQASHESNIERGSVDTTAVASNIFGPPSNMKDATKESHKSDEVLNYEVSRTVSNKIIEGGRIKRLSIAILVDGIYQPSSDGKTTAYQERTPEELEKLKALVISAVGFDQARGDKIEIANLRFASDFIAIKEEQGIQVWLTPDLREVMRSIVAGIVLLLVLLLLRPMVMKVLEIIRERQEHERYPRESGSGKGGGMNNGRGRVHASGVMAEEVDERRRNTVVKKLNEMTEESPEDTVSIIRHWLRRE